MRTSVMLFACFAALSASSATAVDNSHMTVDSIPAIEIARDLTTMTADELRDYKLSNSHKIAFVGDGEKANVDSIAATIALFYVDQFRQFEDPLAPYFMLMSRNARIALGIGGSVRMRGWADFDGSIPANGFSPYLIPVPKNPDMQRRIGGTPGGTALFLQVVGRNPQLGDIIGYIQCDFSATDNTFKLKKAYVTICDWTVGWAPTTFSDPSAQAPTIDGAGQNGKISHTTLLVRWLHNFKKNWAMAASLELPQSKVDADGIMTKKLNDYVPDVAVFGQYQWSHNQHVRLSGIVRALPYRDLVDKKQHTEIGWGLQLSSVIYPINRLAIYAMASTGKGYQSYMGDLAIGSYDLVADKSTPGRMYAPLALGLNLGAKYNFTQNIYATVALGRVSYHPEYKVDPTDYKYGLYGSACLFWDMTSRLQTGIEYLHGSRHNFNGQHASANRVDLLFQFSF